MRIAEKLNTMARRPKTAQAMAMRARIVLDCARGLSNSEVARKLHITGATVGKWRERFRQSGLDGLLDEPRVGAPRKISDQKIEEVVTKTLESAEHPDLVETASDPVLRKPFSVDTLVRAGWSRPRMAG